MNEVLVSELSGMSEKERQRVFGEVNILKTLKHRGIMRMSDWWFDPRTTTITFITELFKDGTLRQ